MIKNFTRKLPPCPYYECESNDVAEISEGHSIMFCKKCFRTFSWFGHYTRLYPAPGFGVWIGDIRRRQAEIDARNEQDYGHNPDRDRWAKMMEVPGE